MNLPAMADIIFSLKEYKYHRILLYLFESSNKRENYRLAKLVVGLSNV